ncbi:MAG: hypothetical protein AAGF48_13005 [Pseudomonadota bacterium]
MSLEQQVAALAAAQAKTNEHLVTIAELLAGGPAPVPANDDKPAPKPKAAPKKAAPKPEAAVEKTFDDVRAAFLAYQSIHGKEKGKDVVRAVTGIKDLRNIGGVPEDKFGAVIDALLEDADVRSAHDAKLEEAA